MKLKHLILTILILSTLLALFSCRSKEFAIVFDSNGGSYAESQLVKEGEYIIKPEAPTKEGHTFKGWYYGNSEWAFLVNKVQSDMTLTAKWEVNKYKVSFDTNGGDGSTEKTVSYGETISSAPIPSRANYSFLGWYNGDTKWNFNTDVVTSDLVLVAKWEAFTKKVTFNAGDGTVSENERKVRYGDAIGELPRPTRFGFDFVGWYDSKDVNMENPISFDYIVTSNVTLVAKWEMNQNVVSVEFIAPNSTLNKKDSYRYLQKGDRIGTLPMPTKKNYVLDYWKNDSTGEKITANTIVNTNITCVAVWKKAVLCVNGTTNHAWSNWSLDYMERSRTCIECASSESITLENVTSDVLGDSYPIIEGDVWGAKNANNLINGIIENDANGLVSCKGSSSVTITLELESPTEINMIYVSGMGMSEYSVTVTLENNEVKYLGEGNFGQICGFDVENNTVTKVVITMSNPSTQGTDIWQEIILAR